MPHFRALSWLLLSGLLLACPSGAFGQAMMPWQPHGPLGVVFVANGSGDDLSVSENLHQVLRASGIPLCVETIRWSRCGGVVRDHLDVEGHLLAGAALAEQVAACRAAYPWRKIYLMSHSAGSHVILAATELLPAGTVDRIVLLAPTVSCWYDLRPALRCAREGIDCYFSRRDMVARLAANTVGTADGQDTRTAGEHGFCCPPPWYPDAPLFQALHQFGWDRSLECTGHEGNHYGATTCGFLSACVLPTMLTPARGW